MKTKDIINKHFCDLDYGMGVGYWTKVPSDIEGIYDFICSICLSAHDYPNKRCPHCGAVMEKIIIGR